MRRVDSTNVSPVIASAHPTIAVWGIGAIEQHSSHLPLGTDWVIVREVTARVAEELAAYLVPAFPFSMSQCHGGTAGTVWLKPKTLAAVVRDVVDSLQAQGIHRILMINGHGGNFVLGPAIRELNLSRPDLRLILLGGELVLEQGRPIFETAHQEVHAGEVETSFILAIDPDAVRPDRVDFVPPVGREFLDYALIGDLCAAGVWGYPRKGSDEKGNAAIEAQVQSIVHAARRTFATLDALLAERGASAHGA